MSHDIIFINFNRLKILSKQVVSKLTVSVLSKELIIATDFFQKEINKASLAEQGQLMSSYPNEIVSGLQLPEVVPAQLNLLASPKVE